MERLLRFPDLVALGVVRNRTCLYNWIRDRGFPRGILIGPNSRAWPEDEVQSWIAEQAQKYADLPPVDA